MFFNFASEKSLQSLCYVLYNTSSLRPLIMCHLCKVSCAPLFQKLSLLKECQSFTLINTHQLDHALSRASHTPLCRVFTEVCPHHCTARVQFRCHICQSLRLWHVLSVFFHRPYRFVLWTTSLLNQKAHTM